MSQLDSLVELDWVSQLAFSTELVWVALRTGSAYTWNPMGTDYNMALPCKDESLNDYI